VARYTWAMQAPSIRLHGSYRYRDRPALEDALARARDVVLDDELEEAGSWMRFFVTTQTTVVVNLSIPAEAPQRYAAANLLLALAHGAVEGAVAAEQDGRRIDVFAAA
jgi:hypothetical protein